MSSTDIEQRFKKIEREERLTKIIMLGFGLFMVLLAILSLVSSGYMWPPEKLHMLYAPIGGAFIGIAVKTWKGSDTFKLLKEVMENRNPSQ